MPKQTTSLHVSCDIGGDNSSGCGSSDGMTVYEDGSKHCFACNTSWFPPEMRGQTYQKDESTVLKPIDVPKLEYVDIKSRGISAATCRKYGIGIDPDTKKLWQLHYVNGIPIGAKLKWYGEDGKKRFSWVGDKSAVSMFGLHVSAHRYKLIITEGELDAAAAHEMTGYGAISLPFGAPSAADYVRKALPLIERAETVYVCVDMDETGREANDVIMNLITPGKAHEVVLPQGYKDACEMSADGKGQEFKNALFASQPRIPSGIMSPDDVLQGALDFAYNTEKRVGISFGIPTLDKIFGGFRPAELSGWVADTGVGKSTVCRQLMFNLAQQGHQVLYVPLEDVPEVSALQLAALKLGRTVLTSEGVTEDDREQLTQAIRWVTQHVTFLNHIGTLEVDTLTSTIEYAVRASGIKVVVLDHITALAEGSTESATSLADKAVAHLRVVVREHMLHGMIVSHIRKPSNVPKSGKVRPTLAGIKHASSIPQACNFVVGMYPPPESRDVLELFVLKGARSFQSETSETSVFLEYDRQTTHLSEPTHVDIDAYTVTPEEHYDKDVDGLDWGQREDFGEESVREEGVGDDTVSIEQF